MKLNKNRLMFLLLLAAFLVRLFPIDFPIFTQEEARIAFRGYSLITTAKDELGRSWPLFFNSLDDYQLPAVSYITAAGELLFGKTDFGVRIPFILIGTVIVWLIYLVAKFFNPRLLFNLSCAALLAASPVLIFLSKIPNEIIVLTCLFLLLFYLLISEKKIFFVTITMILISLISKLGWFILPIFTFFTLTFLKNNLAANRKKILIILSVIIVLCAFGLFLTNDQAKRSLMENNFTIFTDITIKNGINRLRGQGNSSVWSAYLGSFLFNKAQYFIVGCLHFLSHFNPLIYFGQFDASGKLDYSFLGSWTKVLILPTIIGISFLLKERKKNKLIFWYFLILNIPAIFNYPNMNLESVVLTLPFMSIIIAFGLLQMDTKLIFLIFFLIIFELAINIYNFIPEYKNTDIIRPTWIKNFVIDVFNDSRNKNVLVSDDFVSDIVPFIEWNNTFNPQQGFLQIPSPYKFHQYSLGKIKIIGSEEKFTTCGLNEKTSLFISQRDLKKIKKEFNVNIIKEYKDSTEKTVAYYMEDICKE